MLPTGNYSLSDLKDYFYNYISILALLVTEMVCFLTLLSIVGISITGHTGGEPPSQTGPLSLGALVFYILPIPDNIVLPLQLSDHHEELILKFRVVFTCVFITILNSSVMAVLLL